MAEALVPGQWPGSGGLVLLEQASAKWPPWSQRGPGSTGIWKPALASRFPEAPGTIQSCSSQCIWLPRATHGHSSPCPKVNTADLKSLHLTSHVGECYCLCDAPGLLVCFFLSQRLWSTLMRPKVSVERVCFRLPWGFPLSLPTGPQSQVSEPRIKGFS